MYTTDAVRLSEYEAFTVAHLEGEIDLSNAIEIETELTYAVPDEAEGLIIDLSDVSSIDSTGLALPLRPRRSPRPTSAGAPPRRG